MFPDDVTVDSGESLSDGRVHWENMFCSDSSSPETPDVRAEADADDRALLFSDMNCNQTSAATVGGDDGSFFSPGITDWLDFDKDLDEFLSDVLNSERSAWIGDTLPEKTILCDDSCNSVIYQNGEQSMDEMCILGIDLFSECENTSDGNFPVSHNLYCDRSFKSTSMEEKKVPRLSADPPAVDDSTEYHFAAEKSAFPCMYPNCNKLYAKLSHLKAHLRRHNGVKPFACTWPLCTWRFSRSDELARHRRSHSGDKPYRCSECVKRFSRSDHLSKHRKVHRRRAALQSALVGRKCRERRILGRLI